MLINGIDIKMVKELHVSPLSIDLFGDFIYKVSRINNAILTQTKLVIIFTLVVHYTVVYVPGKYFLFVKVETSSVRFLIQDINLGSTDNFGLLRRSVCFIPHFLTTERIKDNNGLPLGELFPTTTLNIKGWEMVYVMKLNC